MMISSTSFSTSSSFVCRCSACEKASSRCYTYYGILTMTTLTMAMRLREGELIEQPRRGGGLAVARLVRVRVRVRVRPKGLTRSDVRHTRARTTG